MRSRAGLDFESVTMTLADIAAMVVADDGNVGKGKGKGLRGDRPKRRSFTPEFKLDILAQYELLTEQGARGGALLRKEGLYSSHISEWKRLRDAGALNALAARPSGPKPAKTDAEKRAEKFGGREPQARC